MINFEKLQLLLILELNECHSEVISTTTLRYTHILLSSDPDLAQVSLQVFPHSLQANDTTLPQSRPQQLPSTSLLINYSFIILAFNTTQSEVQKAPLTIRHRASCILGQAFHYSPENAFYIYNQQIYFII